MLRLGSSVGFSTALLLTVLAWPGLAILDGQQALSAVELASSHIRSGHPADAVPLLNAHLKLTPSDQGARIVLVLAFLQSGSTDDAVRLLRTFPAVIGLQAERQQLQRLVAKAQEREKARYAVLQALVQFRPNRALQLVDRYSASFKEPELAKAYINTLMARFDTAAATVKTPDAPVSVRGATVLSLIEQRHLDVEKEEMRHFGAWWATESTQPPRTKNPQLQPSLDLGFTTTNRDPSTGCYMSPSAALAQQHCRELLKMLHASRTAARALAPLSLESLSNLVTDAILYGSFDQVQRVAATSVREYGLIELDTEHRPPGGVSVGVLTIDATNRLLWHETVLDIHGDGKPLVEFPNFAITFDQIRKVASRIEFEELTLGYRTIKDGGIALDFGEERRVPLLAGIETVGLAFSEGAVRRAVRNFQQLVASIARLDPGNVEFVAVEPRPPGANAFDFLKELAASPTAISLETAQTGMAGFWADQMSKLIEPQGKQDGGVEAARRAWQVGANEPLFRMAFDAPDLTAEINSLLDRVNPIKR